MKDIKVVKDSLRIMDANYVSSKKIDEDSYDLRFTYKKRNYILHINRKYKLMMLETTDSIYGMNINTDTLELINYIREMITFTEFENKLRIPITRKPRYSGCLYRRMFCNYHRNVI